MTARLTIVRTQPLEPIRLAEPRPKPSAAWCVLWLLVPIFWGATIWAVVVRW